MSRRVIGPLSAATWWVAVAVLAALERDHVAAAPRALASSPAGVADGRLWTLLTSGVVIAGPVVVQLIGAGIVVWLAVDQLGPARFWLAALAGHVGATLVAYAGIGVLWLVRPDDVRGVAFAPDYGISCIWAASLGALLAVRIRSGPRPRVVTVAFGASLALFAALVPLHGELADVEHLLAFAAGAGVGALPVRSHVAFRRAT